jgi:TetR/AcrR family transcriptional repressor of nem operon
MFNNIFCRGNMLRSAAGQETIAAMPYPQGHRDETRTRIVRSAQRLFNVQGFAAVSIDEIMAAAHLTRGGFYRYFASKSDLYAEAMDCFFTNPACGNRWEGVEVDPAQGPVGPQIVRAYLSRQHFQDVEDSCPMVALPGDVARAGANAKRAYETALNAMIEHLQADAAATGGPDRRAALAIAALCIGGMVIARASADLAVADEVREAAMQTALGLGGW